MANRGSRLNSENAGIDSTHNPEFTVCEAYQAFMDLEGLMHMTEDLLLRLSKKFERVRRNMLPSIPGPEVPFERPYPRLEFIPAVEAGLQRPLPDLSSPDAGGALLRIFDEVGLTIPSSPTLPRLLDRLSSIYIEPQCVNPTFVMYHPECLSPLAKSFKDPRSKQRVSARMELFVKGQELVNAYEEENSPVEQRRKFVEQLRYREDDKNQSKKSSEEAGSGDGLTLNAVDESYLQALEWGLPPTGGWGCGIDRLVMLFAGTKRIGDVLSFGTLRNVVGLEKSSSSL